MYPRTTPSRSAVLWLILSTVACASYPARRTASVAVHVAVFKYQREEQAQGSFATIFVNIEEPPHWYAPRSAVFSALAKAGIRASAYVSIRKLPDAPPAQQLYLQVYARPERDYPDQVVILGGFNSGDSSQGGTYRYFVEPRKGIWQVVRTEPVAFDTDSYGNFWFECSSKRPS